MKQETKDYIDGIGTRSAGIGQVTLEALNEQDKVLVAHEITLEHTAEIVWAALADIRRRLDTLDKLAGVVTENDADLDKVFDKITEGYADRLVNSGVLCGTCPACEAATKSNDDNILIRLANGTDKLDGDPAITDPSTKEFWDMVFGKISGDGGTFVFGGDEPHPG